MSIIRITFCDTQKAQLSRRSVLNAYNIIFTVNTDHFPERHKFNGIHCGNLFTAQYELNVYLLQRRISYC